MGTVGSPLERASAASGPFLSVENLVYGLGGKRTIKKLLIANNGNAAVKAIRSLRSWCFATFGDERAVEIVVMVTPEDIEANAEYLSESDYLVDVPGGPSANNYSNLHLIVQVAVQQQCDAVWPGWGHASENPRLPRLLAAAGIIWVGPGPPAMLALGDKVGSTIIAQSVGVPCVPWSGDGVYLSANSGSPTLRTSNSFCVEEADDSMTPLSKETGGYNEFEPQSYSTCSTEHACAVVFNRSNKLPPPLSPSEDLLLRATVGSAAEALAVVRRIGLPCMLKSSAGGGGKGIRKVFCEADVADAFFQVINEVRSAPVFVMRLVQRCRHLEVQVLCDEYGNAISLGTRDCSIQRRCQKIIEEGPALVAPSHVLRQMEESALRLCLAVGYIGAATVEYIYDLKVSSNTNGCGVMDELHKTGRRASRQYDQGALAPAPSVYFLEVNARLQVEHVVTEELTGVNLPAAQLQIAMGLSLTDIPDIQRFIESNRRCTITGTLVSPRSQMHCIAARVTAEHAENSFRPTCGEVYEIQLRTSSRVWGYFSIGTKGKVHEYADSQIGHIFATGGNRDEARRALMMTLKGLTVRGEIRTNVEALLKVLEASDFILNKTHTTWVEECVQFGSPSAPLFPDTSAGRKLLQAVILATAYDAFCVFRRSEEVFLEKISQGQLPPPIKVTTSSELVYQNIKFEVTCFHTGPFTIAVELNGSRAEIQMRPISLCDSSPTPAAPHGAGTTGEDSSSAACFLVSGGCDEKSRRVFYKVDSSGFRVTCDGATYTFTREMDPSQVRAPVSGRLSRWLAASGGVVTKGQPYAEIEIMKMYMQLHVPESGILSHALAEGAVFKAGELLASLELGEGIELVKPELYTGQFPEVRVEGMEKLRKTDSLEKSYARTASNVMQGPAPLHQHSSSLRNFRQAYQKLMGALNGYYSDKDSMEEALAKLVCEMFNPALPRVEFSEKFAVLDPYLPADLSERLLNVINGRGADCTSACNTHDAATALSVVPAPGRHHQPGGGNGGMHQISGIGGFTASSSLMRSAGTAALQQALNAFSGTTTGFSGGATNTTGSNGTFALSTIETGVTSPILLQIGALRRSRLAAANSQLMIDARIVLDALEEHLSRQASDLLPQIQAQLQPLLEAVRKYESGLLLAAVDILVGLLSHYLSVEDLFHRSPAGDSAAKVLLKKRTEIAAAHLAVIARSHQALAQRTALIIRIMEVIYQTPGFSDLLPLFLEPLQRLSSLTNPEYSEVSLKARQLLLCRKQKPFLTRTLALVESLADYLERRQPVLFPGGSLSNYCGAAYSPSCTASGSKMPGAAPTPLTPGLLSLGFSTGGHHQLYQMPQLSIGGTPASALQSFVVDLDDAADECLIVLMSHPSIPIRKVALEIFVRRYYERLGLHNLTLHTDGERWTSVHAPGAPGPLQHAPSLEEPLREGRSRQSWRSTALSAAPGSTTPKSQGIACFCGGFFDLYVSHANGPGGQGGATGTNETLSYAAQTGRTTSCDAFEPNGLLPPHRMGRMQRQCRLLGIWSHSAVLTLEFLNETCDVIVPGRIPDELRPPGEEVQNVETLPTRATGSAPRVGRSGGASAKAALGSGSRLHHMLSAFAFEGGAQGGRSQPATATARPQTTVAMAFSSFAQLQLGLRGCLEEFAALQNDIPGLPALNTSPDARMLLLFVADMASDCDDAEGASTVSQLQAELSLHSGMLAVLGFNLIGIAYLHDRRLLAEVRSELTRHFQASLGDPTPLSHDGLRQRRLSSVDCTTLPVPELQGSANRRLDRTATATGVGRTDDTPLGSPLRPSSADVPGPALADFGMLSQTLPRFAFFRNVSALPFPDVTQNVLINRMSFAVHPVATAGATGTLSDVPCTMPTAGRNLPSNSNMPLAKTVPSSTASSQTGIDGAVAHEPARFVEEAVLRNVNPASFERLELPRLTNFTVRVEPTSATNITLFEATPIGRQGLPRYFVRVLLHHRMQSEEEDTWNEQERHFVAALNALEVAKAGNNGGGRVLPSHHLLLSVLLQTSSTLPAQLRLSPANAEQRIRMLARRYEERLMFNRVSVVEVRYAQRSLQPSDSFVSIRLLITNPTGQSLRVQKFVEITDPTTGELIYSALDGSDSLAVSVLPPLTTGPENGMAAAALIRRGEYSRRNVKSGALSLDGLPVNTPHPLSGPLEQNRALAASLGTIYVYDFLDLFEEAIKKSWRSCPKYFVPVFRGADLPAAAAITSPRDAANDEVGLTAAERSTFLPDRVLESVELCVDSRGEVEEIYREPGLNICGMVAWKLLMRTPEFPRGRRVVLIANDVTFNMGTFGVEEDLLFQRVSEFARKEGVPRIYIAVNSGARMGLATEVQRLFRIEWVNPDDPSEGFKYLYLTEADYRALRQTESVAAEPVDHPVYGRIYRITTVIGAQIGLGVENLCGSGAIAGETSRAYQSSMTLAYVTGRTVGIGAYITRLSQRVIQKASNAPILLTGFQALNRLNGRDVYSSNDAIGGVDIMARNGVSHLVVQNDFEGCETILRWLSYIAEHREGPLPIMVDPTDPITRPVTYKVRSLTEDPRLCLTGCIDSSGRWLGGIFDRGSFCEVLADWAKSVIVGRARLGGIPVGVITVETRVTEAITPADPAMSNSSEMKLIRAGQVWYPDSAYKTAQAINDFNKEEIPVIIFANWRGFSGGQRDMFHEVLKFGSFIVDALVNFRQPCLVYIPPKSELRGGAWVVVDPRINAHYMDMYAAPDCRGGVLEPTGTVEIRFRTKALTELATRLDPVLIRLSEEDRRLAADEEARDGAKRQEIRVKMDKRLHDILPVYKQVAVHFADLHDTSTRMKRRAAIQEIVPWEKCRLFFYWRIRRQLVLFNLRAEIMKVNPNLSLAEAEQLIDSWAKEAGHSFNGRPANASAALNMNSEFVQWACHALPQITQHLIELRKDYMKSALADLAEENPEMFAESAREVLQSLPPPLIDEIGRSLQRENVYDGDNLSEIGAPSTGSRRSATQVFLRENDESTSGRVPLVDHRVADITTTTGCGSTSTTS